MLTCVLQIPFSVPPFTRCTSFFFKLSTLATFLPLIYTYEGREGRRKRAHFSGFTVAVHGVRQETFQKREPNAVEPLRGVRGRA